MSMKKRAKETTGIATGPKKDIKKKVFRGGEVCLPGCNNNMCSTNNTDNTANV
jgi:hypothetical protein